MFAAALFIAFSSCLELAKRADASWLAVAGAPNALLPFDLVDEQPADTYFVTIAYSPPAAHLKGKTRTAVAGIDAVNELLRAQTLRVDGLHAHDVHATLTVEKDGEDPLAPHKVSVEHSLKIAHSIPIEQLVNRTEPNTVFPLEVARIAPPFAQLPLITANYTIANETDISLTLTQNGGAIELDAKNVTRAIDVRFRVSDPVSGLHSDFISVHIAVPSRSKGAKDRRGTLILCVSAAVVAVLLSIVVFEARWRAAKEKANATPSPLVIQN